MEDTLQNTPILLMITRLILTLYCQFTVWYNEQKQCTRVWFSPTLLSSLDNNLYID